MHKFRINGQRRLRGSVQISGAKNAALPALAATLLTEDPVMLRGVPPVADVRTMSKLLGHLGSTVQVLEETPQGGLTVALRGGRPDWTAQAPYELVKTMRASVLVLGPALARTGQARVSLPGGCAIGVRPVDQHLAGLEALGAQIDLEHGYVTARADRLTGANFRFAQPTVGGTENVMMAATLARGTTRLENCAREPEIVDLAALLVAMGAEIEGAGSATIEIEGRESLHGADHRIIPDRIEAGTYLIAGLLGDNEVRVEGALAADLLPLLNELDAMGADLQILEEAIVARGAELGPSEFTTAPHPGFPTDLQAQFLLLGTQVDGVCKVHEKVFENRFQHVPELNRMGAAIELRERTAITSGRRPLSGAAVMATDLRASACLVLAGLIASGVTEVDRIYHLDRGYQDMELKLQKLGAEVERIGSNSRRGLERAKLAPA